MSCSIYAIMHFYRKELIQKLHNFVHLNLCIALSLGLLFFLTGIQTAAANIVRINTPCIIQFNGIKCCIILRS